mgnify:FL=1
MEVEITAQALIRRDAVLDRVLVPHNERDDWDEHILPAVREEQTRTPDLATTFGFPMALVAVGDDEDDEAMFYGHVGSRTAPNTAVAPPDDDEDDDEGRDDLWVTPARQEEEVVMLFVRAHDPYQPWGVLQALLQGDDDAIHARNATRWTQVGYYDLPPPKCGGLPEPSVGQYSSEQQYESSMRLPSVGYQVVAFEPPAPSHMSPQRYWHPDPMVMMMSAYDGDGESLAPSIRDAGYPMPNYHSAVSYPPMSYQSHSAAAAYATPSTNHRNATKASVGKKPSQQPRQPQLTPMPCPKCHATECVKAQEFPIFQGRKRTFGVRGHCQSCLETFLIASS